MTSTEKKLYDMLEKWEDYFVWDTKVQPMDYSMEPDVAKLVKESRKVRKEVKNG